MPMLDFSTSWSIEELFDQAVANVSDDTRWLVQTQSAGNLVLRREKGAPFWKLIIIGLAALVTLGVGLLLLPIIAPDMKNQQIAINGKPTNGKVTGRITYTSGARKQVSMLMQSMPRT